MDFHSETARNLNLLQALKDNPELQIQTDEYDFNVTAKFGKRLSATQAMKEYVKFSGRKQPAHLYFHMPLCSYICHYCNYIKTSNGADSADMIDRWASALVVESERYLKWAPWLHDVCIESVYFGGGTAALMKYPQLQRLIDHIRQNYNLIDRCEITLEGNPDNFQLDEAEQASSLGFNRFSVGVQSLQDEVTEVTGRGHDSEMSIRAIERLVSTGKPTNVDIMFGLPRQNQERFINDLDAIINLGIAQTTIYRLRNSDRKSKGLGIADKSHWNIPKIKNRLQEEERLLSLEETYAIREAAVELLLKHNFNPAPACWWSRGGVYPSSIPSVSRNKWERMDTMIAFGPGAYGWLTGDSGKIIQLHNTTNISEYLKSIETTTSGALSHGIEVQGVQAAAVALGYAFKACRPIDIEKFNQRFEIDILKDSTFSKPLGRLVEGGFLETNATESNFYPTLLGEAFFEEIVSVYFNNWIGQSIEPSFDYRQ